MRENSQLQRQTKWMNQKVNKGNTNKKRNKKEKHQQRTQISNQQRENAHKETPPYQMEDEYRNQKEKITWRSQNIYGLLQVPA